MSVQSNLNSKARQARRAKMEMQFNSDKDVVDIMVPREPEELFPFQSQLIPTVYNQRLPEWRERAANRTDKSHWSNLYEFQFAILSFSLGISRFFYFPLVAAKYGSGTFVICFIVAELVFGYPILFLQLAVGQFFSKSVFRIFSLVPLCQGVGISLVVYNLLHILRLNTEMARVVYTIYNALASNLPQESTGCEWDDEKTEHYVTCGHFRRDFFNITNLKCFVQFVHDTIQGSGDKCESTGTTIFSGKSMNWPLVGCLVIASLLVFIFIYKGIKTYGKALIWLLPIMYVALFIFICSNVFKYQSLRGMRSFFNLTWDKVHESNMWYFVMKAVIDSLSLDTGAMIMIGSYARFTSSTRNQALYTCLVVTVVTLVSGTFVSGYIAVVTAAQGVTFQHFVDQITAEYESSFYVIMLSAVDTMYSFPSFWASFLFCLVLLIEMTTEIGHFLVVIQTVMEASPPLAKWPIFTRMGALIIGAIITLPFLTLRSGTGLLIVNLFGTPPNNYWGLSYVCLMVLTFILGYGLSRLRQDIQFMTHHIPNKYIVGIWICTPILLVVVMIFQITHDSLERSTEYRLVDEKVKWSVFLLLFLPIFSVALWKIVVFSRKRELGGLLYSPVEYGSNVLVNTPLSADDLSSRDNMVRRESATVCLELVNGDSTSSGGGGGGQESAPAKKRVMYNEEEQREKRVVYYPAPNSDSGTSSSGEVLVRAGRRRNSGRLKSIRAGSWLRRGLR